MDFTRTISTNDLLEGLKCFIEHNGGVVVDNDKKKRKYKIK